MDVGHFLGAGIQNVELEIEIFITGNFMKQTKTIIDLTTNQESKLSINIMHYHTICMITTNVRL